MKGFIKKTLSFTCIAGIAASLVACGSANSNEGESQVNNNSTTGEITFWSVFTGPDGETMNKMVNEYNKTNPKYKVKHVPMEQNDLYSKIPTVVGSGKDVPDLTIIHAERIPLFAEQGILMPLTGYIEGNDEIKEENYISNAWKVGSIDGEQYSIPLDVHSFVTYYNEDLIEKYAPGILDDCVLTMEEVIEASNNASADGIKGLGITWMQKQYLSYLGQLNGDITEDGTVPTLNTPESIEVLTKLSKLVEDGIATQDGDDPGQLFRSGQLLFLPEGTWMLTSLTEIPNLNFGITNMPTFNAENQVNCSSSHQFVMLKNKAMTDEKAQGILDFITWVGQNSLEWAKAGQIPANLAIAENEEFKELKHSFILDDTTTIKIFDYKYFGYAVESLDKVIFEACFGRLTPENAANQMQKETEEKVEMAQ